jgi:hypothetical protein
MAVPREYEFDDLFYMITYPDVGEHKTFKKDLYYHYRRFGVKENRFPTAESFYNKYPEHAENKKDLPEEEYIRIRELITSLSLYNNPTIVERKIIPRTTTSYVYSYW